jgi:hypothetical protein
VEGQGAMELTADEQQGVKRMDLKETNPNLTALAQELPHAAFRYHRQPGSAPALRLKWTRFPASPVLTAQVQRAVVTTMVTPEGRTLTEVRLTLTNRAQPFLKIGLPAGASILSSDAGGDKTKPVQGADGVRVPLLRAGFRPAGAYEVSYVFVHSGAPFARKGASELGLPKMDIPIGLLEWEVFLPERYKVDSFSGDATAAEQVPEPEVTRLDEFKGLANAPAAPLQAAQQERSVLGRLADKKEKDSDASSNVLNLQRRVAGVLPVPVEVPRAGTSYRFARALVLDEETRLAFRYRTK